MKTVTFQVYPDSSNSYRWRVVARNKKTTATSGESFASKQSAERAVKAFVKSLSPVSTRVVIQFMENANVRGKVLMQKALPAPN